LVFGLSMILVIAAATVLTYLTPAGSFARHGDLVQPGTWARRRENSGVNREGFILSSRLPKKWRGETTSPEFGKHH